MPVTPPLCSPTDVLTTWFGPDPTTIDDRWFKASDAFDRLLRDRFAGTVEAALRGELLAWEQTLDGRRALLLVLDQFPRNLFRGTARAFAGDARALALTDRMLAQADDAAPLTAPQRWFIYMPLMHAESLAAQDRCVECFTRLANDDPRLASALDYARRHRDVIQRFGRFPHRNEALQRPTTDAEAAFLLQPGSRF